MTDLGSSFSRKRPSDDNGVPDEEDNNNDEKEKNKRQRSSSDIKAIIPNTSDYPIERYMRNPLPCPGLFHEIRSHPSFLHWPLGVSDIILQYLPKRGHYVGSYFCSKSPPRIWAAFETRMEAVHFATLELKAVSVGAKEGEQGDHDDTYQMNLEFYKTFKLPDEDCICRPPQVFIQEFDLTVAGSIEFTNVLSYHNI